MNPTGEILAPPGWGYLPGARLDSPTVADLPGMPMLRFFGVRERNSCIAEALRARPEILRIARATDVAARYGINYNAAYDIIRMAKR